jgi:transient receptor potential cation channel subfamily V protein 6
MILAGSKEEHLDMLDGGIIQRLLEEKWKTFAQRQFLKRITIAFIHLIGMSIAVYLRPKDRTKPLMEFNDVQDIIRLTFELATVVGCLSYVIVQQGEEIKNQGLFSYVKQLVITVYIVYIILYFFTVFRGYSEKITDWIK